MSSVSPQLPLMPADTERAGLVVPGLVVGVDCGLDGAVVALGREGRCERAYLTDVAFTRNVSKGKGRKRVYVEARMAAALRSLTPALVVLEKQAGFSRPARDGQPARQMGAASVFSVGLGYGLWRGICAGLGLACLVVSPRTWQAEVLRDVPGDATKARAILAASQRVPSLDLMPGRRRKAHEGLADAACLALYGLRRLGAGSVAVIEATA